MRSDRRHMATDNFQKSDAGLAVAQHGTPSDLTTIAAEAMRRHVQAGHFGFVVLDDKNTIAQCYGEIVAWITPGQNVADAVPFLAGYEKVFAESKRSDEPCLVLSRVAWVDPARGQLPVFSVYAYKRLPEPGILLVFQDVSDVAELEQQVLQQRNETVLAQGALRESQRQAEAANRAKSAFLANISHELRTPLNIIIGNAEILSDPESKSIATIAHQSFAQDIFDSGTILLELVNDLLDLAKAEAGHLELVEETVVVGDILDAASNMAQKLPYAQGIEFSFENVARDTLLRCDPRRVRQIVLNLLSNSIKFTPVGQKVSLRSWTQTDGTLAIQVSDSGAGIPAEEIEEITAAFVQGSRVGRVAQGTGLGLHLVKTFADLHDAQLEITSELDQGTSVVVRFPARRVS